MHACVATSTTEKPVHPAQSSFSARSRTSSRRREGGALCVRFTACGEQSLPEDANQPRILGFGFRFGPGRQYFLLPAVGENARFFCLSARSLTRILVVPCYGHQLYRPALHEALLVRDTKAHYLYIHTPTWKAQVIRSKSCASLKKGERGRDLVESRPKTCGSSFEQTSCGEIKC